jgi:hypothetical protein
MVAPRVGHVELWTDATKMLSRIFSRPCPVSVMLGNVKKHDLELDSPVVKDLLADGPYHIE